MYFLLIRYFLLQLIISLGENTSVISEEKYDLVKDVAQEQMDFNSHRANRRFQEDLEDKEWHVAHLRDEDTGFGDAGCRRLTFDERSHKYKRVLKEDGSRVKFVSADAIPADEDIKVFNDPCLTANSTRVYEDEDKRVTDSINNTTAIEIPLDSNETIGSVTKNSITATTTDVKKGLTTESDRKHGKRRKIRREGEDYQFSSVEYYDELQDFDESKCPDDVKVIELQIDQLRAYDIECEIMIEWRSLE